MRSFLTTDPKLLSSIVTPVQLAGHRHKPIRVINALGINEAWEDAGPAIEISRCLQAHQLNPIPFADTADS